MSYRETVRARIERTRAKLRSIEAANIQRFSGDADPRDIESELRRQIARDEEILQDLGQS
jgi:hypothetical protein